MATNTTNIKFGDQVTYLGQKGFYSELVFRVIDIRRSPADVVQYKIIPVDPDAYDVIEFLWVGAKYIQKYVPRVKQLDGWKKI